MESISKQYERDLESSNETLTKKLENTEALLDNYNQLNEEKERKYQEILKESLDTIYQLASALHKYKSIAETEFERIPTEKEVEKVGQHYLRNFIRYSKTHPATVSSECQEMVDDFLTEIHNLNSLEKLSA